MSTSKTKLYIVLRAICIAGERVEPDSKVELGPVLGAELSAAGKVRLAGDDEAGEAAAKAADHEVNKPTEPPAKVVSKAKPKGEAAAGGEGE